MRAVASRGPTPAGRAPGAPTGPEVAAPAPPAGPESFRSLAREAEVELEIRRSRFIARAAPVFGREAAEAWIAATSARHPRATHNVPAYVAGLQGQWRWCSDAGEPAGTAGRPVLEVLEREGLTQVAVVVTRYFGGVKLGAAGLVRAYARACAEAVAAARPVLYRRGQRGRLRLSYGLYGTVRALLEGAGARVLAEDFGPEVEVEAWVPEGRVEALARQLADRTAGAIGWPGGPWEYRPEA